MADATIQYCDVVMKGGITSGIVYPNAILALSGRYHFKNIGGTSAGAIAAAASVAAALGERRKVLQPSKRIGNRASAGFSGLAAVAETLKKRGFIYSLFQPAPGAVAAFRMLVKLAERPSLVRGLLAAIVGVITIAPVETIAALLILLGIGFLIGGAAGYWAALLPSLICALAVGAIAALLRVARVVRRNSLGLCAGVRDAGAGQQSVPALTEWLHTIIQSLSGQAGRPLLFQDLWEAPRYLNEPGEKALSLQMITTGISHHEPRALPFENATFWFRQDQFLRLFPSAVVSWMMKQDASPLTIDGQLYFRLPKEGQLPVIVATRMSLSFPILLSAVPLYEADSRRSDATRAKTVAANAVAERSLIQSSEALATGGARSPKKPSALRICWFSDGGIGSNFPIHLFDAPLPRWPTFAIDLVYPKTTPGNPQPTVFLPTENNQGWQRRYSAIAAKRALTEVSSFLFAIVGTMQNWRDLLQSRAPGHRDRIVRIPLTADEGGLNLNMPQDVLNRIAKKGEEAGTMLAEKFDFNNHWWVRWRNVSSAVERFTIGFAEGSVPPPSASYAKAYSSARTGQPDAPSYRFTGPQQQDAQARFATMEQQGQLWKDTIPDLTTRAPKPLPQLRITPTF